MISTEITTALSNYKKLRFEDLKVSYLILKPNAAKHYMSILNDVESQQFRVINQYAIVDYETVNMALHIDQPEAMRYIIPITRMYKDFYGNYGVLVVIGKNHITYNNFCLQVVSLKRYLRGRFELPYISYAFDISELGQANKHERLLILAQNGLEVSKDKFNREGTYMVFSVNEVHSPDENVESTIKEMEVLKSMALLENDNIIPKTIINSMKRYNTFEFLKDMLQWFQWWGVPFGTSHTNNNKKEL